MSAGADVVDRGGDLAVGTLAQSPAVLPLDAHGVLALLGKAGVVDDEDAFGRGEGLGHGGAVTLAEILVIPEGLVDEVLQSLLGIGDIEAGGQKNASGEGFDALALAVDQQTVEINVSPVGLSVPVEVGPELSSEIFEPVQDVGRQVRGVGLAHTLWYEQTAQSVP